MSCSNTKCGVTIIGPTGQTRHGSVFWPDRAIAKILGPGITNNDLTTYLGHGVFPNSLRTYPANNFGLVGTLAEADYTFNSPVIFSIGAAPTAMIDWDGKLVADFGDSRGLYTYGTTDTSWQLLDSRGDVNHMLVWNGNLVVDFGSGRGMWYNNGSTWTWMTNKVSADMIAWDDSVNEKLVVDFGPGGGIYTYPSVTNGWDWLTNWDGVNDMIVWDHWLVIDFGLDRGIYYHTGSNWGWLTNWDSINRWMTWYDGIDEKIVIDFGSNRGIYSNTRNGVKPWTWMTNWDSINKWAAWNDGSNENLGIDFGSGRGIYYLNNSGWTWMTNNDSVNDMVSWNDGITEKLVIDFGTDRSIYSYTTGWEWLTNLNSIELLEWENNLAADFGSGNGIWYHDTTEWKPTNDWSTAD